MEKLSKRGLVTSFTRAKVKYYSATDPELVLTDFKKKVEDLEVALPVLKQMGGEAGSKPKVMNYEGLEAIKTIFKSVLSTDAEILMYANIKEIETHWSSFMEDIERKRMEYELPLRLIALNDARGTFMKEYDDEFQRKTRLAPKEQYDFTSTIIMYDNKVAIISFQGQVGVVIEETEIAKTHRMLFEMHWKGFHKPEPTMVVRKVGTIKAKEKESEEEILVRKDQSSLF